MGKAHSRQWEQISAGGTTAQKGVARGKKMLLEGGAILAEHLSILAELHNGTQAQFGGLGMGTGMGL